MENFAIKNIDSFIENEINKTRITVQEKGADKEIILEGEGTINIAIEA